MVEKKFIKGLIKIDYIIYEKAIIKTLVLNSLKMKNNKGRSKSSPDSCVKCYTMFYHFYLSKLMYFLEE